MTGPVRVRAVVLPHPPLLCPELTGPGATDAEPLRAACRAAVEDLLAARWPALMIVGSGSRTRGHPPGAWGTLAGYGADVRAPAAAACDAGPPQLPLSLTLGCRLLDLAAGSRRDVPVDLIEVDAVESVEGCRQLGIELALRRPDAGWLVLGDGTTRRTERAPGAFDPRAASFDGAVESALASGDPERLLDLDVELAADLGAAGRSAWQVLAGAWEACRPRVDARAKIDYSGAPFGVGYVVARWSDPS